MGLRTTASILLTFGRSYEDPLNFDVIYYTCIPHPRASIVMRQQSMCIKVMRQHINEIQSEVAIFSPHGEIVMRKKNNANLPKSH